MKTKDGKPAFFSVKANEKDDQATGEIIVDSNMDPMDAIRTLSKVLASIGYADRMIGCCIMEDTKFLELTAEEIHHYFDQLETANKTLKESILASVKELKKHMN